MSEHSRSTRLSTAALVALTLVLPAGPLAQQQCEQRYQLAPEIWGRAASCFWNGTACFTCTLEKQFADGACVNDC